MTVPQNNPMITGSKTMQMVADDQHRLNKIQMTAVQRQLWILRRVEMAASGIIQRMLLLVLLWQQTFNLHKVTEVICGKLQN